MKMLFWMLFASTLLCPGPLKSPETPKSEGDSCSRAGGREFCDGGAVRLQPYLYTEVFKDGLNLPTLLSLFFR